jgi:uncharacterized membrane protein
MLEERKMKASHEFRALARAQLKGSWIDAVITALIFSVILSAASFVFGIGTLIVGGPLCLGFYGYFLNKARGQSVKFENLFDGFSRFIPSLVLYLLYSLFICLWSLLFVIPGLIKQLSYSMCFYIMRDNPEIGANEAITRSKKMMNGNKMKLFCLYLSFIGWFILACFTFGIGFLWFIPYVSLAEANFYEELKKNQQNA